MALLPSEYVTLALNGSLLVRVSDPCVVRLTVFIGVTENKRRYSALSLVARVTGQIEGASLAPSPEKYLNILSVMNPHTGLSPKSGR